MMRVCAVVAVVVLVLSSLSAAAGEYVQYLGAIKTPMPLGRIEADPVRGMVYGISNTGDVVFMDAKSLSVDKVISTQRCLRDIDVSPDGSRLYVLDNVTGEYWNQPPAVYVLGYDLATKQQSSIVMAQAPLYQMALGRPDRLLGVQANQWVNAYQVNLASGQKLSTCSAGYYGGTTWTPQTMVSTTDGNRLFRTEVGLSSIELIAFDTSTDTIRQAKVREVGSYSTEPVFLNSTDSSLYVGDLRVDPADISRTLAVFPEMIYAGLGDDSLCFGANFVYDAAWGQKLEAMPVHFPMMDLGNRDSLLYAYDTATSQLHVMQVVPEPVTLALLAVGAAGYLRRRQARC